MKAWKRLANGHYIDLNDLTLNDIDIDNIEKSLNYIYRFNGHHKDRKPLTVAQHTLLCMNLSDMLFNDEKVRRACLIHDFGEAFYGDITTQVKRMIGRDALERVTKPVDDLINKAFWYPDEEGPDGFVSAACKVCDLLSLDIERRIMWRSQLGKDKWPDIPPNKFSLFDKQQLFDEVASIQYVKLGELL